MLAANPWPTIRDPMPRANVHGNNCRVYYIICMYKTSIHQHSPVQKLYNKKDNYANEGSPNLGRNIIASQNII